MPTYVYQCPVCKEIVHEYRPVKDMDTPAECSKCGQSADRIFHGSTVTTPRPWFKPGYDVALGAYVETKEDRQRVMKEKGLAEL